MADDFFQQKKAMDDSQQLPDKVKVGEKEYTQDELSRLVGLGETANELETKWNTKIDSVYPAYTKTTQELAELKKEKEEREGRELEERAKQNQLTPEEVKQVAIREARELGLVTREDFATEVSKAVANAIAGKELLGDIQTVIDDASEKGQPKTEVNKLLDFMSQNGIKNPEKAYKLMFEAEIDAWKEQKLKGIKPPDLTTQTISTAGGKEPPAPPAITKDNLAQIIRESLTKRMSGM